MAQASVTFGYQVSKIKFIWPLCKGEWVVKEVLPHEKSRERGGAENSFNKKPPDARTKDDTFFVVLLKNINTMFFSRFWDAVVEGGISNQLTQGSTCVLEGNITLIWFDLKLWNFLLLKTPIVWDDNKNYCKSVNLLHKAFLYFVSWGSVM